MAMFEIGEAVKFGWGAAKKNFWFFAKLLVIYLVVLMVLQFLQGPPDADRPLTLMEMLAIPLSVAVQIVLSLGLITIALKLIDGKVPELKDLWSSYKPFWAYLGASILTGLGVTAGFFLLVIPGIILALGWMFYSYLIIDRNLSAVESMKRSWEITRGQRWQLLGLGITLWFINVLGVLLVGIGLLWTIPTAMMAMAYVYRKLESGMPVPAAVSAGGKELQDSAI